MTDMTDTIPVAWQYRPAGKKVWDSCGEFTYNKFKEDPKFEVRRLCVLDVMLRENSKTDGHDVVGMKIMEDQIDNA